MKWIQASKQNCPIHDKWLYLKLNDSLPCVGYRIDGRYVFNINNKEYSFDQVQYLDESSAPDVLPSEETARKIWEAAVKWVDFLENGGPHGDDFETFYKQLIEGK